MKRLHGRDFTGYLYLEITGVLAPDTTVRLPHGFQSSRLAPERIGDSMRRHSPGVRFNRQHGAQLMELAASTGLALYWASSGWKPARANEFGRFLGLPPLPALVLPATTSKDFGKAKQIAHVAGNVPFAWLDSCFDHADVQPFAGRADVLVKSVDPRSGLSDRELDAVRQWALGLEPVLFDKTDPGPVFLRFRTRGGDLFARFGAGVSVNQEPVYRFVPEGLGLGTPVSCEQLMSWEALVDAHGPLTALGPHA